MRVIGRAFFFFSSFLGLNPKIQKNPTKTTPSTSHPQTQKPLKGFNPLLYPATA
jgi:hypothetical protein